MRSKRSGTAENTVEEIQMRSSYRHPHRITSNAYEKKIFARDGTPYKCFHRAAEQKMSLII